MGSDLLVALVGAFAGVVAALLTREGRRHQERRTIREELDLIERLDTDWNQQRMLLAVSLEERLNRYIAPYTYAWQTALAEKLPPVMVLYRQRSGLEAMRATGAAVAGAILLVVTLSADDAPRWAVAAAWTVVTALVLNAVGFWRRFVLFGRLAEKHRQA